MKSLKNETNCTENDKLHNFNRTEQVQTLLLSNNRFEYPWCKYIYSLSWSVICCWLSASCVCYCFVYIVAYL